MLARVFTERLIAFMVVIAFLKLGEADRRGESPGAELDRFTFRFTTGPPRTRRPRGLRGAVREISCSTNVFLSVPLIGLLARKRSRSTLAWAAATDAGDASAWADSKTLGAGGPRTAGLASSISSSSVMGLSVGRRAGAALAVDAWAVPKNSSVWSAVLDLIVGLKLEAGKKGLAHSKVQHQRHGPRTHRH